MKTKDKILNMFPKHLDFWMGMNCGKVDKFILSSSRKSAIEFMDKLKNNSDLYEEGIPYNYQHSQYEIKLFLKNGDIYLWKPINCNTRGDRFGSLIIDVDNVDFTEDEWSHIVARTRCGRDKIWFFDEFRV